MKTLKELLAAARKSLQYDVQGAILDFTEGIARRMKAANVTKTDLAHRLNCSQAFVTKILRGQNNFTLETMVKIARALGSEVKIEIQVKAATPNWDKIVEDIRNLPEQRSANHECKIIELADLRRRSVRAMGQGPNPTESVPSNEELALAS